MIRHIFTLIWNERRTNVLIALEFTLIFCILWFCVDYLWFVAGRYFEPRGFDIENTYLLDMGFRPEMDSEYRQLTHEQLTEQALSLLDRVGRYPGVEAVSLSNSGIPYSQSYNGSTSALDTAHVGSTQVKAVTPSYFDVFRIPLAQGRMFYWPDPGQERSVIIAPDHKGEFIGIPASQVERFYGYNAINRIEQEPEPNLTVAGVTEKIKMNDFEPYGNMFFEPLNIGLGTMQEPAIRVAPEVFGPEFARKFLADMKEPLDFGRWYLSGVTPMNEVRREYNRETYNRLNGVFSVTGFLVINIFLGVLGTFWLRTQSRRAEIGLRMALGASRGNVQRLLLGETVVLLAVASVAGAVICLNIGQTDLLEAIGVPSIDREEYGIGAGQDVINFALTFLFLAAVSTLAVWYPSRQAAATQPAEVLHEE